MSQTTLRGEKDVSAYTADIGAFDPRPATAVHYPTSVDEVIAIVNDAAAHRQPYVWADREFLDYRDFFLLLKTHSRLALPLA
jgi:hypothetical protein